MAAASWWSLGLLLLLLVEPRGAGGSRVALGGPAHVHALNRGHSACLRSHVRASPIGADDDKMGDTDEDADDEDVSDEDMEAAIFAAIAAAGVVESLDAEYYNDDEARVNVVAERPITGLSDDDIAELREQCELLLGAAGREGWGLNVLLTGDEEVRELNREHRGKDAPTDILSYSLDLSTADGAVSLGDLAISIPYVERSIAADAELSADARAADEQRGGAYGRLVRECRLARRLPLLIVHGICHLLGYDHENDADHRRMIAKEEELLEALGRGARGLAGKPPR